MSGMKDLDCEAKYNKALRVSEFPVIAARWQSAWPINPSVSPVRGRVSTRARKPDLHALQYLDRKSASPRGGSG